MSQHEFEQFMLHNIGRYRRRRQKIASPAPRLKQHNPLHLLYLLLLLHPNYVDPVPRHSPDNPFAAVVPVKAAPTAIQLYQTLHFKKLRINGSPITLATFVKQQPLPCECRDVTPAQQALELLNLDQEPELPTGSVDEVWDTVNAEVEVHERTQTGGHSTHSGAHSEHGAQGAQGAHSASGDGTSSGNGGNGGGGGNGNGNGNANGIGGNGFGNGNGSGNANHDRSERDWRDEAFAKDYSPTPKHRPLHHTLKPKRLILKLAVVAPRTKVDVAKYMTPLVLSELNLAYDNELRSLVLAVSVSGTILREECEEAASVEDDVRSIQLILKLKGLLEEQL